MKERKKIRGIEGKCVIGNHTTILYSRLNGIPSCKKCLENWLYKYNKEYREKKLMRRKLRWQKLKK